MGLWREEEAGSLTNRSLLIKTLSIIQTLNHYLLCSSASSTRDVPSLDDTSRECWLMQDRNFRISLVLSVFPAPLSPLRGENTRVVRRLIFWETLQQGTEMILIWNDYSSSSASVAVCFCVFQDADLCCHNRYIEKKFMFEKKLFGGEKMSENMCKLFVSHTQIRFRWNWVGLQVELRTNWVTHTADDIMGKINIQGESYKHPPLDGDRTLRHHHLLTVWSRSRMQLHISSMQDYRRRSIRQETSLISRREKCVEELLNFNFLES